MFNRKQYMDREVSHADYYDQFVTPGVTALLNKDRVQQSTDPHFNDIPLTYWDRLAAMMPSDSIKLVCDANMSTHGGKRSYSLSDCVCTLKAAARRLRDET